MGCMAAASCWVSVFVAELSSVTGVVYMIALACYCHGLLRPQHIEISVKVDSQTRAGKLCVLCAVSSYIFITLC